MAWQKKRKNVGGNKYYSVANLLRRQHKTTPQFEIMLSSLSLEEVIALKLELAAQSAGQPLYGVPIWQNLIAITREAVIKYALSATRSKQEAARFLGMDRPSFWEKQRYYGTYSYFASQDPEKKDPEE